MIATDPGPQKRPRLLLVGCGRMGGALLTGLRRLRPTIDVLIADPSPVDGPEPRVATLAEISAFRADIVVLAVKPGLAAEVVPQLRRLVGQETAVVSFLAGVRLTRLRGLLGEGPTLIRAMPNLAMAVGAGACGLFAPPGSSNEAVEAATGLFAACGEVVHVTVEEDLDAVTAVSGSGPAYVFRFVEALAAAGVAEGLAPDIALRIARQTVIGAGAQLASGAASAAQLREQVTSPGGTTAQGLAELAEPNGLDDLLQRAVSAAATRAREFAADG